MWRCDCCKQLVEGPRYSFADRLDLELCQPCFDLLEVAGDETWRQNMFAPEREAPRVVSRDRRWLRQAYRS